MERRLNQNVDNAGVFGYGSLQSLMRAEQLLKKYNYKLVFFSVLVESDFGRVRNDFRSGFPKPSLIKKNNALVRAKPPSINVIGSKFHPDLHSNLYKIIKFLRHNSKFFLKIIEVINKSGKFYIDYTGSRLTSIHPQAASKEEVIDYFLKKFNELNVKTKILVLQYDQLNKNNDENDFKTRKLLYEKFNKYNFIVIDSFDYLRKKANENKIKIWDGHHTKYGNELICKYIIENTSTLEIY